MRKNIVVANWKMNLDRSNAISLAQEVLSNKADNSSVEVVFAPSFLYIYKIAKLCMINENFSVAAQDCSLEEQGAFTGEVSASMLASCNATKVIIGHSERRIKFKESNEELKNKVLQAYGNALDVIFCCGESLEQRDKGLHFDWIKSQMLLGNRIVLSGFGVFQLNMRKQRRLLHPITQEPLVIPERLCPQFTPADTLLKFLNYGIKL